MNTPRVIALLILILALGWGFNQYRETKTSQYSILPSTTTAREALASAPLAPGALSVGSDQVAQGTPAPIPQASPLKPDSVEPVGQRVNNKYPDGRENVFDTPHVSSAQKKLDQRAPIDPDKDFESLATPDFNDPQTAMFSGTFEDQDKSVQLQFIYELDTPKLSKTACVVLKESGPVAQLDESIQLKDDRSGSAGVMLKNRWYLKLAYTFNPRRTLIGKLYQRGDHGWFYLYDFAAQEAHDLKLKCEPRPSRP